jgi:uncharacterized membrane protein
MSAGARRVAMFIALLAAAGIVDSAVSLKNHYAKDKSAFCDINETLNCDIVNRSQFSVFLGVPVAAIGLLGYSALLLLATWRREHPQTPLLLLVGATAGLGFALYLTYIEKYILGVYCILCLFSLALIVAITVLASTLFVWSRQNEISD